MQMHLRVSLSFLPHYSSAGSSHEMFKEPTRQHETFIAHNVEFMLEEQKDGVCDQHTVQ